MRKNLITIAAATSILLMGGVGGAVASGQIGSSDIRNGGIHLADLSPKLKHQLHRDSSERHTVFVTHFNNVVAPASGDASGLHLTGEGAYFGPFANGGGCSTAGQDYARLVFNGLNGKRLDQVHQLDYTGQMTADDDTGGVGSLTMRVYTNGNGVGPDNNVGFSKYTFSPNTQFNQPADYSYAQGQVHTWLTTVGTWRDNDDAGSDPSGELPWSHWASAHANEKITKIDILLGCEAGTNLQGVVRSIQANGTTYQLGRIG